MRYYPEVAHNPWNIKIEGNPTFAVLIGETVQNIRTALDYLVYALVVHTRRRRPKEKTQFPIYENAGKFFRDRDQISELPGELRRRIRKLQPYQAKGQRSETLNLLRRLSNADKHRLLIDTVTELGVPKLRRDFALNQDSVGVILPSYLEGTKAEQQLLRRDPNTAASIYFVLLIGEKGGGDAFEILKRMLWTATEIIDGFEDACV
jgi:hypothetical protein